jgi:glutamine kinase
MVKKVMKLKLLSKAKTLETLAEVIISAKVLPQRNFFVNKYQENKEDILSYCMSTFGANLIVRSSSSNEDNNLTSNAGGFDSVANVALSKKKLDKAILKVIDSYGDSLCKKDEVFIQPMLENVSMGGVIFTSDIDTLAPYYVINYDESGSTSSVTSGEGEDLKTVVVFKKFKTHKDTRINKLINASKECEKIFDNKFLDIEFAFSGDELFILQVRAIVKNNKNDLSSINLENSLEKIFKKIKKLNSPHPKLLGSKSIFGVMPDWNPAEIIGVKPKRLSLSLYKEIVTDEIWAYQRENYGYRNLRSFPLLVSFMGVPYIDVRVSFNSFIPKNLHDSIASKLVEYYLEELSKNSNHHDKVEFEIVYSCYYFGIDKKIEKLKEKGFNSNEIKRLEFELLELTNSILDIKNGLYKKDLNKIELLRGKYDAIVNSNLSIIDKIYWLIEDCKRYGTLPFAGVARAAFIAVQFLNSFVEEDILSDEDKSNFLNSLETISKELSNDKNYLDKNSFLEKYGHLRPGTYDICSKRYDEAYDEYFSTHKCEINQVKFEFSPLQKEKISKLIIENGLKCNFNGLITFIKESIEGREYAKFVFTKHLSKILLYVEEFGLKQGFTREELSYIDFQKIKNLYSTLDHRDVKTILNTDIEKNMEFYKYTQAIKLPSIIINEEDIYSFTLEKEAENFITLNSVNGLVVDLDSNHKPDLKNKIVCIKSADPGYDYLFAKNIGGLITCYGGANSHMAIRCAEMGIPAVIGCGESMFEKYIKANTLLIDAGNKQVKIIS